jgi:hypothetical protein
VGETRIKTEHNRHLGLGRQRVTPIGVTKLHCKHNGKQNRINCQVPNLLSLEDSVKTVLIKTVDNNTSVIPKPKSVIDHEYESAKKIIDEYMDDQNSTPVAHPIPVWQCMKQLE